MIQMLAFTGLPHLLRHQIQGLFPGLIPLDSRSYTPTYSVNDPQHNTAEPGNCNFLRPHLHPFLPADPQVAPGEEAGHCVSGQVMNPALLP